VCLNDEGWCDVSDSSFFDLFRTPLFWAPFVAWVLAQLTKTLCGFATTKRLDFRYIFSLGGMPSAHSAMMCSMATVLGLRTGFDSPVFVLSGALAVIVMLDASTVRHAAGQQARLLNEIIDEFFKSHRFSERKLVELLGHTRLEVVLGMVVGILVAMLVNSTALVFSL
jgi:hypothetical protein